MSPGRSCSCSVASLSDDEADEAPPAGTGKAAAQGSGGASPQPAAAAAVEQRRAKEQELGRQLMASIGCEGLITALGLPDPLLCRGEVEDVTPACAGASEAERAQQEAINRGDVQPEAAQDRRIVVSLNPAHQLPFFIDQLSRQQLATC
jgi:hypothetical protein